LNRILDCNHAEIGAFAARTALEDPRSMWAMRSYRCQRRHPFARWSWRTAVAPFGKPRFSRASTTTTHGKSVRSISSRTIVEPLSTTTVPKPCSVLVLEVQAGAKVVFRFQLTMTTEMVGRFRGSTMARGRPRFIMAVAPGPGGDSRTRFVSESAFFETSDVGVDHHGDKILRTRRSASAERAFAPWRIALQEEDLGGAIETACR